ncbi:hypothetical protein Tco_0358863 [Tanacetum coccineum]
MKLSKVNALTSLIIQLMYIGVHFDQNDNKTSKDETDRILAARRLVDVVEENGFAAGCVNEGDEENAFDFLPSKLLVTLFLNASIEDIDSRFPAGFVPLPLPKAVVLETPKPGVIDQKGVLETPNAYPVLAECKASEDSEDQMYAKHQLMIKGLADSKAIVSNLRDIQVRDIVKEVEVYLKTYSPTEMDMRWYVKGML